MTISADAVLPAPRATTAAPASAAVDASAHPRTTAWRGWARGYALGTAAWLAFIPVFVLQMVVGAAEVGRHVPWGVALTRTTDQFIGCLPILPFLGWLVRRAPFRAPHWWRNAALHGKLYYQRLRAQELEAARLAQRLAETQLLALRAQLQPHFLFNTLNAISALMRDEPDVADRMLTRLAELLRVVLEPPPGDEHSLGEELSVLERYLEIMSLRFDSRLAVELNVPATLHAARVPWLVLQPLVENAIEHGAGRRRGVDAARLALVVCDDGPGPVAGETKADGRRGTGIGLENTRRRLAQLYGDAATLCLEALPEGGACARIELPLRDSAAARATTAPPALAGVGMA